ncbi:MAG TPA: patatin-like phospholipase family protein [Pyrinomonadaceae bacterium]|jgi:hypothetical protein
MATGDPLPLWQVLKEEYQSFHGPLDGPYLYLKDPKELAARLNDKADSLSDYLKGKLPPQAKAEWDKYASTTPPPDMSERLRGALTDVLQGSLSDPNLYRHYDEKRVEKILEAEKIGRKYDALSADPLTGNELTNVNERILVEAYPDGLAGRLQWMYSRIREQKHAAVCLSGGGIRSATFNLGMVQGLARHGLLEKFDYLSTVSGGGYTGGWLSAWVHREGLKKVVDQLSEPPTDPIEPEPKPLVRLRAFSNYLSPRLGLLSADTWTMIATLLRNIILNWLVFIPMLIALLLLPRMWLAFHVNGSLSGWGLAFKSTFGVSLSLAIGFAGQLIALTYIGLELPSTKRSKGNGFRFVLLGLLPLVVSAMAFATFWARYDGRLEVGWWTFVRFAWALVAIPLLICFGYRLIKAQDKAGALGQIIGATALVLAAQFVIGLIAWAGGRSIPFFASPREHIISYSCLAVPLILGLLMLGGTLMSGLTSRYTEDDDQEWWARAGAGIYIVNLAWVVFFGLVLYGPYLFTWLSDTSDWKLWFARIGTVGGVVSGAISLIGGFSSRTPANEEEAKKAGAGGMALQLLTSLLAPLFLAFILALLSFAAGWLLTFATGLGQGLQSFLHVSPDIPASAVKHLGILLHTSLPLLVALCLLFVAVGAAMSRAISTNKFSLHYFWRNRIIRAYLGASHDEREPNPFTGFDTKDNISMHELRPRQPGSPVQNPKLPPEDGITEKKLLHVLNFALNLAGSKDLALQERKATSFTVSPLHAGNYKLGYRKAFDYGRQPYNGKQGISLGTSVAISGAFASPNMGYMMSSPVVRFIMTLFNVRFGWWLGNPGKAGDDGLPFGKTYDRDSPRLSMIPIFQEALGLTNDQAGYVYLSDGGHFENLGLYEMVLRRCRVVVIGDGSSDEKYTFQSLGLAIRQVRIDLGVPIEFQTFHITGRSTDGKGAYCAVGKIRYSCVDGGSREADGDLILVKPALLGDEPRDVLNYASEHATFPQEFIGDQWFSESQFESYRALGSHIVDAICREVKDGAEVKDRATFKDQELDAFARNLKVRLATVSLTDFEQGLLNNLKEIPLSIDKALAQLKTPPPTNGENQ